MEKHAVELVKDALRRAKSRTVPFAFAPNGDHPILLFADPGELKLTVSTFRARAEENAGVSFEGGAIAFGSLAVDDEGPCFSVDDAATVGQINAAKMQRTLVKLAKAAKLPLLVGARVEMDDGSGTKKVSAAPATRDDAGRRVEAWITKVGALLTQAAMAHGDAAKAKPVIRQLAEARDEFKLFLESDAAKGRLLDDKATKQRTADLVRRAGDALAQVRQAGAALRASIGEGPKPDVARRMAPPAFDREALGKVSGTLGAAADTFDQAFRSATDDDGRRAALHALRTELLAWDRKHPDEDSKAARRVRAAMRSVEDRLTGHDVQRGIESGQFDTTGGGGKTGGASGSYFVGDGTERRAFVVKPIGQEALVGPTAEPGDGARNEIVASRAGTWLRQHGLDLRVPDAHLVVVESDLVGDVGDALTKGGTAFGPNAKDRVQQAAAVRVVPKVTGQASSLIEKVHKTIPAIRVSYALEGAEATARATELFTQHDPTFATLSPQEQATRVETFLAKGGHDRITHRPNGVSKQDFTRDLAQGVLLCVVTGQLDHSNPDNAVTSKDGDRERLVPIDFGLGAPTTQGVIGAFDLDGRPMSNDPWALWVAFPEADDPIPPDLLEKMATLAVDELASVMEEEEDRVAEESQRLRGDVADRLGRKADDPESVGIQRASEEQRMIRRFMLKALQETFARAKRTQPAPVLTPRLLHDVFVRRAGNTGPFALAMREVRDAKKRGETGKAVWAQAAKVFAQHLKVLLEQGP